MSMHITETPAASAEIRALTDTELDDVNSGLFGFLAGVAAGIWLSAAIVVIGKGAPYTAIDGGPVLPPLGT